MSVNNEVKFCLQAVQKDIESRSRIVSAVLKLCDWLKVVRSAGEAEMTTAESAMEDERAAVQEEAEGVEQRWHRVWIQSVEWQLRLEDAINGTNVRIVCLYNRYSSRVCHTEQCWLVYHSTIIISLLLSRLLLVCVW